MTNCIKALLLSLLITNTCYATTYQWLAAINLDEATKEVLKAGNVRVLGAKTETIDGRQVHIIKYLTGDGRIQYEKVDVVTGQMMNKNKK